jgi:hypothetical protein
MESELSAALTALNEAMAAGFARMDRYFEAQHKATRGWLDQLRVESELRRRTDQLSNRLLRLEQEVEPPREYIRDEFAEIRLVLFELRWDAWPIEYLRRELATLTERANRLERGHQR